MSILPTNRTANDTVQEHLDDHNEVHRLHNVYDGTQPSDFVHVIGAVGFRRTQRVQTLVDAGTVTPDIDNYDGGYLTSVSQSPTTIANPTGTPTQFQDYVLRIKSSSPRTLQWGGQFRSGSTVGLPSATTGSSKTDYFGFRWNAEDSKWDILATSPGY